MNPLLYELHPPTYRPTADAASRWTCCLQELSKGHGENCSQAIRASTVEAALERAGIAFHEHSDAIVQFTPAAFQRSATETLEQVSRELRDKADHSPAAVFLHPSMVKALPTSQDPGERYSGALHGIPVFPSSDVPACGYRVLNGREYREWRTKAVRELNEGLRAP